MGRGPATVVWPCQRPPSARNIVWCGDPRRSNATAVALSDNARASTTSVVDIREQVNLR